MPRLQHVPSFIYPSAVPVSTGTSSRRTFRSNDIFSPAQPRQRSHNLPYRRNGRCTMMSTEESSAEPQDLASQIDDYLKSPRTPKEGPLSFEILKDRGREDLMTAMMQEGGSAAVASKLRLDPALFIPPINKTRETLSNFGNTQEGASLKLGRELDDRLDSIDAMQKSADQAGVSGNDPYARYRGNDFVPSGEELKAMNEGMAPRIVDDPVPVDERLTLSLTMRVGLLVLTTTSAIGFGRASEGVVNAGVIQACQSISSALVVAHIVLAFYSAVSLAPSFGRSSFVWFAKILLSGPLGVQYLRAVGSLEPKK